MAIQRFGGALNLNLHFHALYTDGSFCERSDGQLLFLQASPPTLAEMEALVTHIKQRVVQLLEHLGVGPDDDQDPDAQLLLGMGELSSDGAFHKGCLSMPFSYLIGTQSQGGSGRGVDGSRRSARRYPPR